MCIWERAQKRVAQSLWKQRETLDGMIPTECMVFTRREGDAEGWWGAKEWNAHKVCRLRAPHTLHTLYAHALSSAVGSAEPVSDANAAAFRVSVL